MNTCPLVILYNTLRAEKMQIVHILKNKVSILSLHESNMSYSRVYASKTCDQKSKYSSVNKSLYDWYILACSKNVYPMGPQLIENVKQITSSLGKQNLWGQVATKMEEVLRKRISNQWGIR